MIQFNQQYIKVAFTYSQLHQCCNILFFKSYFNIITIIKQQISMHLGRSYHNYNQRRDQALRLQNIQYKLDQVLQVLRNQTRLINMLQRALLQGRINPQHNSLEDQAQATGAFDIVYEANQNHNILPPLDHLNHSYQNSQIQMDALYAPSSSNQRSILNQTDLNNNEDDLIDQLDIYQAWNEEEEGSRMEISHSSIAMPPSWQQENSLGMQSPSKLLKTMSGQFGKMGLKFEHCESVYSYPQMVGQDFQSKILDKNNLMLLMELKNKQIVGAFTQIGFSSKKTLIPKDNPRCCLFNLSKGHFLYSTRTNKTHSSDKNYVLFGNWEIKLKMGEGYFQSDLGTRGDCFTKSDYGGEGKEVGDTREWIFGEDYQKLKFQLEKYMIFIFK